MLKNIQKGHGEELDHTLLKNIPCTSSEARGNEAVLELTEVSPVLKRGQGKEVRFLLSSREARVKR
jgi:hypothetical protein